MWNKGMFLIFVSFISTLVLVSGSDADAKICVCWQYKSDAQDIVSDANVTNIIVRATSRRSALERLIERA